MSAASSCHPDDGEQIDALLTRQQELLGLVAKLSRETPYADEVKGWEDQRRAMIAEIGTLRARVAELEQTGRDELREAIEEVIANNEARCLDNNADRAAVARALLAALDHP